MASELASEFGFSKFVQELLKRKARLMDDQANWRTLWQELADFIVPRKSSIVTQRAPGQKTTTFLFDSTAPDAATTLASSIHGSLTSPTSRWFSLVFRNEDLNEDDESLLWLDEAADKLFTALQQSNFNSEIQEVYLDLIVFGTGGLFEEGLIDVGGRFGGFRFEALPIGTYFVAEGEDGVIDTIFRVRQISARAAVDRWGDKVSEKVKTKSVNTPDEMIKVLHAIFPRKNVPRRASVGTLGIRLPIASAWIEEDTKTLLELGGFHEMPYIMARWTKQAGETYGRGPGDIALPDIKTLNEAVKLRLQAWQLAVAPPMKVRDRGTVGKVRVSPRSLTTVRDMDALQPIQFGTQFDVANFNEEKIKLSIRQTFFNDKLQLPDKSLITATEVDRRILQMQRILGPALGRLDNELLRRIIDRSFGIMLRAREFDPIPAAVLMAASGERANIEVNFDGPLARAQRMADLESMQLFISNVVGLAQVSPEILDNIDFDAYIREVAKATSVPAEILRARKEVAALRQQRAEAQAQALQAQQARDNLAALGQSAPALKSLAGPLETVISQPEVL